MAIILTVHSPPPYVQTNSGELPSLQTHAWSDHIERKAVPLKGGNGYLLFMKKQGMLWKGITNELYKRY